MPNAASVGGERDPHERSGPATNRRALRCSSSLLLTGAASMWRKACVVCSAGIPRAAFSLVRAPNGGHTAARHRLDPAITQPACCRSTNDCDSPGSAYTNGDEDPPSHPASPCVP